MSEIDNFPIRKHVSRDKKFNQLFPLVALSLSACGGGGGGSNVQQSTTDNNQTNLVDTFETSLGSISAPDGNALTIQKVGSKYLATVLDGFVQSDTNTAVFDVVDDTHDNKYTIDLSATGAGQLEFKFDDSNDSIILTDVSTISGVSSLKITNGTLDATRVDLGTIEYVEVASSVKLKASQLEAIKDIVAGSNSSEIIIEITSASDLNALQARMEKGLLKIYSDTNVINFEKSSGSALDNATLSAAKSTLNALKSATTTKPNVSAEQVETVLLKKNAGTVKILNDDTYINLKESADNLSLKITLETGFSVQNVKIDGQSLTPGSKAGEYLISTATLNDGVLPVVVDVVDVINTVTTFETEVVLDRIAPEAKKMFVVGESNGLNSAELATNPEVLFAVQDGVTVSHVALGAVALTKNVNDNYFIPPNKFEDGSYGLVATIRDLAGNESRLEKTILIDADSLSDAEIIVSGAEDGLNKLEASGQVDVSINLASNISIQSLMLDDVSLIPSTSFSFDASQLAEGSHTVTVVTNSSGGVAMTTEKVFLIDRTSPGPAELRISGDDLVINSKEVDPTSHVFVTPQTGSKLSSLTLDGINVNISDQSGIYTFNSETLSAGFHEFVAVVEDASANSSSSVLKFMKVGSNSNQNPFEIVSTPTADGALFEVFYVNDSTGSNSTLSSFSMTLAVESAKYSLDESSISVSEGGFKGTDSSSTGTQSLIRVSAAYLANITDFSKPIMSFSGVENQNVNALSIDLTGVTLGRESLDDMTYFIEIA